MTPDIHEIIKVSLKVSKHIMFYVPRTLMLEELFCIISEIKKNTNIYFDIHILKSANKIKALLIIFGYDIDKKIEEKDVSDYLKYIYDDYQLDEIDYRLLTTIAKVIGNFKFFENEINFRKNISEGEIENNDIGKKMFNYFFEVVLTDQEKIKIKSLKIYSLYKMKYKNNKNINNNNVNIITRFNFNNHINFIEDNTEEYSSEVIDGIVKDNIDCNIYKKKFELKNLDEDKKITISSSYNYETVSTSSSLNVSLINKNNKNKGDWALMPCKEISFNYQLG